MIYLLAESNQFLRSQLKIKNSNSSAYREMDDAEYVLRFVTLSETWMNFSGDYKESMNEFMRRYRTLDAEGVAALKYGYERAISACQSLWGEHAFHRPTSAGWRAQLLAGMYDAEMIAVSLLSDDEIRRVSNDQAAVLLMTRELFQDADFETAVRTGTNTPSRVYYRVERMYDGLRSLSGA